MKRIKSRQDLCDQLSLEIRNQIEEEILFALADAAPAKILIETGFQDGIWFVEIRRLPGYNCDRYNFDSEEKLNEFVMLKKLEQ
jgi:hypothetical protein